MRPSRSYASAARVACPEARASRAISESASTFSPSSARARRASTSAPAVSPSPRSVSARATWSRPGGPERGSARVSTGAPLGFGAWTTAGAGAGGAAATGTFASGTGGDGVGDFSTARHQRGGERDGQETLRHRRTPHRDRGGPSGGPPVRPPCHRLCPAEEGGARPPGRGRRVRRPSPERVRRSAGCARVPCSTVLVASWNINSVRARTDRLLGWLEARRPDVLCLQELKCTDEQFPSEPVRAPVTIRCSSARRPTTGWRSSPGPSPSGSSAASSTARTTPPPGW